SPSRIGAGLQRTWTVYGQQAVPPRSAWLAGCSWLCGHLSLLDLIGHANERSVARIAARCCASLGLDVFLDIGIVPAIECAFRHRFDLGDRSAQNGAELLLQDLDLFLEAFIRSRQLGHVSRTGRVVEVGLGLVLQLPALHAKLLERPTIECRQCFSREDAERLEFQDRKS